MPNQQIPTAYHQLSLSANAYVEIAHSFDVALDGSVPFSIDTWVKFGGLCTQSMILSRGNTFAFGISGHQVFVQMAGFPPVTSDADISGVDTEAWHYIAVTYDGSTMSIFIDGYLNTQQMISGSPVISSEPILIGANLQGRMNELRVFNRALPTGSVLTCMFGTDVPSGNIACFDFSQYPPLDTGPGHYSLTLRNGAASVRKSPSVLLQGTAYCQPIRDTTVNPGGGGSDAFTVQAWVCPNGTRQTNMVFVNADLNVDSGMALFLTYDAASEQFLVNAQHGSGVGGGGTTLTSSTTIDADTWSNIATTYDGATLRIYINGQLDKSVAAVPVGTQAGGNCLIGAALRSDEPSGDDTFQGYIALIDVWDMALNAAQIGAAMVSVNDNQANQTAHFNFLTLPVRNSITGQPSGLCDGAELGNQTLKMTGSGSATTLAAGEIEEIEQPPTEVLEQFRRESLKDTAVFLEQNPDIFQQALAMDIDPQNMQRHIPARMFVGHKKKMQKAWAEAERTMREEPEKMTFRISTHQYQGDHHIVLHSPEKSEVVFRAGVDTIDECTLWKITIIWTIVSGLLSIFGITARITTAIKTFVSTRILGNVPLMTLIRADLLRTGTGAIAIFDIILNLYHFGLLWPLIKMILKALTWWAIGRLLVKLLVSCFGAPAAAAETIASLVVAAVQVAYVLTQKPKDCTF